MNTLKKIYLFVLLFCPLFVFSQRSTVIISEVLYDAPLNEAGGDTLAHNGEFVSLYNYGNETVDVGDWSLWCDGWTYIIPTGTKMLPRSILVIAYRARGSNFDVTSFYSKEHSNNIPYPHQVLYQNSLILPNNVSVVRLRDTNNHVQDNLTYAGTVYNGIKPTREGYLSVSLQRKNISIDPSTGFHFCPTYDYITGISCLVRLFAFNENSTLTYTYEDGRRTIIESFDERGAKGGSLGHPLPGSLSVSGTGDANYTIPIDVPVGIRDMQPKLSLFYNSNSGIGVAGLGFHLQGLSAIMRITPNIFYDGYRSNELTKFMLDGQRMIEASISDTATYYKVIDAPSLNIIYRDTNGNNDRFVVQTPEGLTMLYGSNTNSSLLHSGTSQKLSYMLRETTDGYGNKITYTYQTVGGQIYIYAISYVSALSNYGTEIKFHYINGPAVAPKYLPGGHQISGNRLLSKIEIRSKNETIYYYKLEYESTIDKAYTILKQVRKVYQGESYGVWEELPMSFTWSETNADSIYINASNDGGIYNSYYEEELILPTDPDYDDLELPYIKHKSSFGTGDVDGDGSEDVIRFGWKSVNVYRDADFAGDSGIAYNKNFTLPAGYWKYPKNRCYIIDMNGDGCGDIVGRGNDGIHIAYSKGFIPEDQVRTMNDQFTHTATAAINAFYADESTLSQTNGSPAVLYGDIDGDGLTDVVGLSGSQCIIYRNAVDGFYLYRTINLYILDWGRDDYKLLDINGDGKAELLLFEHNNYETVSIAAVYNLDGNYSTKIIYKNTCKIGLYHDVSYYHLFGDLNGDGFADMVSVNKSSVDIHYYHGTDGYDSIPDVSINEFPLNKNCEKLKNDMFSLGDINGDGLLDIIIFDDVDNDREEYLFALQNTGNGFVSRIWGTYRREDLDSKSPYYYQSKTKLLSDFNGDGISDVGILLYDNQNLYYSKYEGKSDFRRLTGISDGSGIKTSITYSKYRKSKSDIFSYPFRDVSALDVVSEVKSGVNNAYSSSEVLSFHQKYSYDRAVSDIRRGGFLGFLSTTTTDVMNNTVITNENSLDKTRSILYPKTRSTYSGNVNNNNLLSTENYSYSIKPVILTYGNDTIKMLSKKRSKDADKNFIVQTEYNIDEYGNKTNEVSSVMLPITPANINPISPFAGDFGDLEPAKNEITVRKDSISYINYQPTSQGSIIYRPQTVIKTSVYSDRVQKDTVYYTYNAQGDVLTETTREGSNETIYTDLGLPELVTFYPKGESSNSISTYYTYTSDKRFLSGILDDMNNSTEKEYDLKYGRLKSETDIFGRTKHYRYDNYNRLSSIIDEDGIITTFTEIDNPGNSENLNYRIAHTKNSTGASTYTYYDMLGREQMTKTETADGVLITQTLYNNKNQVSAKSAPYFEGDNIAWHNYTYDNLGRLIESEYLGDITTYSYNKLTTTVTEHANSTTDSRTTSKTYNVMGDIIKVSEPAGDITYNYYYPGLPDTIKSGDVKTIITYDNIGRRTSITDPSAGTTTFEYDNQNRLIEQTDANGTTSEYEYDKYGRETGRSIEDDNILVIISNEYDDKSLLLQSSIMSETEDDFYEVTTSYNYDNAGRLLSETQELESLSDEKSFTTSYSYDEYGRQNLKIYPNDFGIEYKYNSYGELSQITNFDDGSNIWQRGARNAKGQYLSSTLGSTNNLLKTSSYDAWGNITNSEITSGTTVLDYKAYDYTGAKHLMSSRSSGYNVSGTEYFRNEDFTYDTENRLIGTSYGFNNSNNNLQAISETQTYESNGNLTYKNGIGNISYNSTNPYRIDKITPASGSTLARSKEVEKHLYGQKIVYTPFQRVSSIIQDSNDTDLIASEDRADFTYNANYERVKMVITRNGVNVKTKYYAGEYEETYTLKSDGSTFPTQTCYIQTPEGLQAAYKRERQNNFGSGIIPQWYGDIYYFGTDHAGSITSVVSESGYVLEHYNYDAWGNRRVMDSIQNYYPKYNPTEVDMMYMVLYEPMFDRGYIGEEHIDIFGLMNLNARLYDPILGRFLSPDPYVQSPDNLQNFNRYSYGLNNPLKYKDPSGLTYVFDENGFFMGVDRNTVNGKSFLGFNGPSHGWTFSYGFLSSYFGFGGGGGFGGSSEFDGNIGGFSSGSYGGYNISGGSFPLSFSSGTPDRTNDETNWLPTAEVKPDWVTRLEVWRRRNQRALAAWMQRLSGGFSLDVNLTFGIGYSFEVGIVRDASGNYSAFYSHGMSVGVEASVGANFFLVFGPDFKLSDFGGESANVNVSIGAYSGSIVTDHKTGAINDHYFNNYGGFKFGFGYGAGISTSHTKTVLFIMPRRDFNHNIPFYYQRGHK
jgi:RHS repeat-associated protein